MPSRAEHRLVNARGRDPLRVCRSNPQGRHTRVVVAITATLLKCVVARRGNWETTPLGTQARMREARNHAALSGATASARRSGVRRRHVERLEAPAGACSCWRPRDAPSLATATSVRLACQMGVSRRHASAATRNSASAFCSVAPHRPSGATTPKRYRLLFDAHRMAGLPILLSCITPLSVAWQTGVVPASWAPRARH